MASGIGNVGILPGLQDIWHNLTGGPLGVGTPAGNQGWFGPHPMQNVGAVMDMGARGQLISRGPQSNTWTPPTQQSDWNAISTPYGINSALFGNSFAPGAGQGAYNRFQDSGNSYLRRYGTNLVVDPQTGQMQLPFLDAEGNQVGYGQGGTRANPGYSNPANFLGSSPEQGSAFRSIQTYGGRTGFNQPLYGSQYDTAKTMAGLMALQQGANPYLNDPRIAAQMATQGEQASPFARANPASYLQAALMGEQGPTTAQTGEAYIDPALQQGGRGVDAMTAMTRGAYGGVTGDVRGLQNQYEQQLLNQMAQQGSKDLSLGLQDAQGTLSSMGLGRSGQGQSTAAGVWADIQQKNALDRQNIMAQFAEANAARNQQTMLGMGQGAMDANARAILAQQQGGIGALLAAQQGAIGGNESRLGRMNAAAMAGQQGLTQSLEASRQAQRAALLGGQDATRQWNLGTQQNYQQALQSGDQAALQRMVAEAQQQSAGMHDYMGLQQLKDDQYFRNQANMLDLEDRYRVSQNDVYNQMAQYGMMPAQWMMQLISGISPTGGNPARTSPWPTMLGGAALNYGGNLLSQMGQPSQQVPSYPLLNGQMYGE